MKKQPAERINYLKTFIAAVLAGMAICIGAVAALATGNRLFGAVIFTVGLYIVLANKYALYTGAICYVYQKDGTRPLQLAITLIGNAIGAFAVGSSVRLTRLDSVTAGATALVDTKSTDSLLSIFILAVLCDFLIFYAVDAHKKNPHEVGKYVGLLLCIPAFIISTYEHCVANMCYLSLAWDFSTDALAMLGMAVLGNTVGGILASNLTRYVSK